MPKVKLNNKIENREQQKFQLGNLQHIVLLNPIVLSLGPNGWNQDHDGCEIEPQEVKRSGCQEVFFCHIFIYLIN